jgi:two-component SAPR family response regulator
MRILIAEDEPGNLEEVERILTASKQNFEIVSCLKPTEALSVFKDRFFDAAILDIQMPEIDGLGLANYFRTQRPDIPIIFLTAHNTYASEAFDLDATDYVLKPVRPERLLKAINKIHNQEPRPTHDVSVSSQIYLKTLGGLFLCNEGLEIQWDRVKTRELFSYLLMKSGIHVHKDELCDELWPNLDSQRALANLQVTICRLRKAISCFDRSQICVNFSNHYYTLILGHMSYDLEIFEELSSKADAASLSKAIEIYKGEFLEPEGWQWADKVRIHYQKKYQHVVRELIGIYIKNEQLTKAENLLRNTTSRFEPDDHTSVLYLHVAYKLGGKSSLIQAYKLLISRYENVFAIQIPAAVQKVFADYMQK